MTQGSSKTKKENIESIDHQAILNKVLSLPISEWNYIHDHDMTKHIGPMAEDFYSTFRLGNTPKGISSIDSSGVALAAIQGLKQQLDEKEKEITDLRNQVESLQAQQRRVAKLERAVKSLMSQQSQTLTTTTFVQ